MRFRDLIRSCLSLILLFCLLLCNKKVHIHITLAFSIYQLFSGIFLFKMFIIFLLFQMNLYIVLARGKGPKHSVHRDLTPWSLQGQCSGAAEDHKTHTPSPDLKLRFAHLVGHGYAFIIFPNVLMPSSQNFYLIPCDIRQFQNFCILGRSKVTL